MELILQYSITADEFADFNAYSCWTAPENKNLRRKTFLSVFFIMTGFAFLGAFIALQTSSTAGKHLFLNPITIGIAVIIGSLSAVWSFNGMASRFRKKALQMAKKPENSHILSVVTMQFDDNSLVQTDSKSRSSHKWDAITKYKEINDCFYLYLGTIQGYIIPKRIFQIQEEYDRLRECLEKKISCTYK